MSAASSASGDTSAADRPVTSEVDSAWGSRAHTALAVGFSRRPPAKRSSAVAAGRGRTRVKNCRVRATPVPACPCVLSALPRASRSAWPQELAGSAVTARANGAWHTAPARGVAIGARPDSCSIAVIVATDRQSPRPQEAASGKMPPKGAARESPANRRTAAWCDGGTTRVRAVVQPQ